MVQIDQKKLWFPENPNSEAANTINRRASFYEKEYGLKTTLLIHVFIRWKRTPDSDFLTSPLICQPAQIKIKKREEQSYELVVADEPVFINPVLRKVFRDEFSIDFPNQISSPDEIIQQLSGEFLSIKLCKNLDEKDEWQLIRESAVGVFNYKKHLLYRDYDEIIKAPAQSVEALLGDKLSTPSDIPDSPFLKSLDESQKKAVSSCLRNHTVIEGPPGNGKSHTLVALIKTLLYQGKRVLFVSQKRSALEVVHRQLIKDQLDPFIARFDQEENEKKQFYDHLKKTWEILTHKEFNPKESKGPEHFPVNLFNFYPQKLRAKSDSKNITISALEEKLLVSGYNFRDLIFQGHAPAYDLWLEHYSFLESFEDQICRAWKTELLSETSFFYLNAAVFSETDPVLKLAKRIEQITRSLSEIDGLIKRYDLPDTLQAFTKYAIAASIMAMVNRNQLELLQRDHKKFKTFNTLAKKYQLVKNKLTQANLVNQRWKKKPSIAEINELADLLRRTKKPKSILGILKRNSTRSINYFEEFSPGLSVEMKLEMLEELRLEWHLQGELEEITIRMKHELEILDPATEIDHILRVRSKLNNVSENEYLFLLEHPDSLVLIRDLASVHPTVNLATNQLHFLLRKNHPDTLNSLKNLLARILNELDLVDHFQPEISQYFKLPESVQQFLLEHPQEKLHLLDARISCYYLIQQTRFEPAYKKLSGQELQLEFHQLKKTNEFAEKCALDHIRCQLQNQFHETEKLISGAPSRLSDDQKEKRKKLKSSRKILLHEMNKSRQHLPIIDLLENSSESVFAVQPLWIMTPLSVSQFIPCTESMFDYVIFDESSQIPLEDAIPAIQRSNRVVVVGDSHQMPPGRFFSSNESGQTLLDQSGTVFQSTMLRFHYRSRHPRLMEFSNRHFYDSELLLFPASDRSNPIELVKIQGYFEDNRNTAEAEAVAARCKSLVESGSQDIGIIAFSKEQESEIKRQLKKLGLSESKWPLIRNLENVQGIEKDTVLISIGYAKNKAGKFIRNFGPVNQDQGANRLNVLLTRARKKMIVFSSVTHEDFELSSNQGVNFLSGFLHFASGESDLKTSGTLSHSHQLVLDWLHNNNVVFNYHSASENLAISGFTSASSDKILLVNPGCEQQEASDLYPVLIALSQRFKSIKIILNTDLILNRERTLAEILTYFRET